MLTGKNGEIYIKCTKPCRIGDLAKAVCKFAGAANNYPIHIIGARPGEKADEALLTNEEVYFACCNGDYIIISNNIHKNNNLNLMCCSQNNELMNESEMLSLLQSMEE